MGRRLMLFPFPFAGHQNPMFELGNILHSRGFSISIIHTRFHSPNPSKYPHFDFHFIDDGLLESEMSFKVVLTLYDTLNKKCVESFRVCLSQIITQYLDQEPLSCVIADHMWYFTQDVAHALKLPTIVTSVTNLSSLTMINANLDPIDKQPDELIMELPYLKVKDIPTVDIDVQPHVDDFLAKVVNITKASNGLIINTIEEFEDLSLAITRQEFQIPIFPIGPFHKWITSSSIDSRDHHQGALTWLGTQAPNSVLYVSFGSLASIDKTGFLEMAWGLANSSHPFLWVIRSDLVKNSDGFGEFVPDGFLEKVSGRGYIVSWAPQKEVLAHPAVGGFWTHSGWNSTLESICEGVPMICSPCFGDQTVNARYVCDVWKIGLELDKGAKADDVAKVITTLMAEKEGEEIRERASCFKNKASTCLQRGGSSYKHMEHLVNLIMSF